MAPFSDSIAATLEREEHVAGAFEVTSHFLVGGMPGASNQWALLLPL